MAQRSPKASIALLFGPVLIACGSLDADRSHEEDLRASVHPQVLESLGSDRTQAAQTDAGPPGALPACGKRLSLDLPWKPVLDLGGGPRAHWFLEGEDVLNRAPLTRSQQPLTWLGVTPSALPLSCSETEDECRPGGSRIALGDVAGSTIAVHTHWQPDQLPQLAAQTPVQVTIDVSAGKLVILAEDGSFLLGIVRYGGLPDSADPRRWQLGPWRVEAGESVCTAVNTMCNYRSTLQSLAVFAEEQRVTVAPAQAARIGLGTGSYQVVNHAVVAHDYADPERASCAAVRPPNDAISIVRLP